MASPRFSFRRCIPVFAVAAVGSVAAFCYLQERMSAPVAGPAVSAAMPERWTLIFDDSASLPERLDLAGKADATLPIELVEVWAVSPPPEANNKTLEDHFTVWNALLNRWAAAGLHQAECTPFLVRSLLKPKLHPTLRDYAAQQLSRRIQSGLGDFLSTSGAIQALVDVARDPALSGLYLPGTALLALVDIASVSPESFSPHTARLEVVLIRLLETPGTPVPLQVAALQTAASLKRPPLLSAVRTRMALTPQVPDAVLLAGIPVLRGSADPADRKLLQQLAASNRFAAPAARAALSE